MALFVSIASASVIQGRIESKYTLPIPFMHPQQPTFTFIWTRSSNTFALSICLGKSSQLDFATTFVSVNSGQYSGLVDNTGYFRIQVPSAGAYKLEVLNLQFYFEPVVVEIYTEEF